MPSDNEDTQARLKRANIQATTTGNRLRISPNIRNNDADALLGRYRSTAPRPPAVRTATLVTSARRYTFSRPNEGRPM